jgi:signal transduction histidine kinase/ligand-binding sensor domain-containing protein
VRPARALLALSALHLLVCTPVALALNPSLEVSQYAHTAWTVRDGFSVGNIYAMAQTPDGYLWLGGEFGLSRFDGIRTIPWQPPAGQRLPDRNVNSLLVTRDGALWIGTFAGLVTWTGGNLTRPPALADQFVASLFEDREGTVWAGSLRGADGRLCALRSGGAQCYGEDGAFGRAVWALYEDGSGTLWAGAQTGLWRIKPGPPRQYAPPLEVIGLNESDDGRQLVAMHGLGLRELVRDRVEPYPIRAPADPTTLLQDRRVDANRLLRDRDGGLWIGTVARGLIHVHHGRTDVFTRADGLSGDVILSLFEDREGNVWVASTGGLDRFRELPVSTVTARQGLSSDNAHSVLAATDGSVWMGTHDGLTRWKDGRATVFRRESGLPGAPQSLHEDHRGRVWVATESGLAYYRDGRFVAVDAVPGGRVHSMTGDEAGHLWLAEDRSLLHLRDGRLVEQVPWAALGRRQTANVILAALEPGGVWLGFWSSGGGGVSYFRDGQLRASYGAADGLGAGHAPDLRLDEDGALWVATHEGGVSRIKDGRVTALTTRNGLPCDTALWTMADDDGSLWLYAACGLVRITRAELHAWTADPSRRIETTVWDAADGVRLRSSAASEFGPRVARAADGRLWFVTGEGVQVVDPRRLAINALPPPVHIEQIVADQKIYAPHPTGGAVSIAHLPPRTRDLQINYTALSLVAPEKVRFKYRLEGQDGDWREVVNDRHVQYSNLRPGTYRFRVIACNNSGVWNEEGDTLELSVAPAYYQTRWFLALGAAACAAMLWTAWRWRLRRLAHQLELTLDARVAERTRIARDLHDTLLQGTQGMLLIFESAVKLLPERAVEARERLERALDQAAEAMAEARHAVQGLRESVTETGDLAPSLTSIAEELSGGGGAGAAAIEVVVDGTPRPLKPLVRDEIYRIAAEALRNAARHAWARHISAEIRYEERQFRLVVRDDGVGIEEQTLRDAPTGHFGLHGLRERAAIVGGRLEVLTRAGLGTVVELSIPAAIAYATSRRPPVAADPTGAAPAGQEDPR